MATSINRRLLLKSTGALVVSFSLPLFDRHGGLAQEPTATPSIPPQPENPNFDPAAQQKLAPELDSWLQIDADGKITFLTGRVEIGNGILTALTQIVAEELDVAFDAITMISADTDLVPNQGITSASTTIGSCSIVMRKAAATARQRLVGLAADQLGVKAGDLTVRDGLVSVIADPSKSVSYGELIGGSLFEQQIDDSAPFKPVDDYTIVGASIQRVDVPGKLTASDGDFNENARVDGMLFARILRSPAYGGKLVSYDKTVEKTPGIVAVVPVRYPGDERLARVERLETMHGDWIGVVAEREDLAIRAVEKLRETAEWEIVDTVPTTSDDLWSWLLATGEAVGAQEDYDQRLDEYNTAIATAKNTHSASYHGPFVHYAPISSAWSLADVRSDSAEIWTATQWPFGTRWMVAQALGFTENEQVRVHGGPSSGLYGRRDDYDQEVDVEAALLSQAVGKPVRLQWSRAEELQWSQYRPPQITRLEAGLSADGTIAGMWGRVWSTVRGSHPGKRSTGPLGLTPYQLGSFPLEAFDSGPSLRTGYMRNVFRGYNIFALESFMDELAEQAGIDPVEFRLAHLADERAVAVLKAATDAAAWTPHVGKSGTGIGVSFALYAGEDAPSGTYLAYVAEVDVDAATGGVRVRKMTCAIDCGLIINPDGLTNQVEGGVIQAMSWTMHEQISFDRKMVTNRDWETYPILTFPEVPEIVTVLVNRPDKPSKSVGEPVTVPVAAAIANAIYDATGARVRELPLTPDRVKAAIG
jgi:CO/xanthine dehydrogenase Mo-binding subunit